MLSTCQSHIAIKDGVRIWTLAAWWQSLYSFCYVIHTEILLSNPGEAIMSNMGVQGEPRTFPWNGSHPLKKALLVQLNTQHTKAAFVVKAVVWRLMSMWLSLRCGTLWGSLGNQLQRRPWPHKRGQKPWLREALWAVMGWGCVLTHLAVMVVNGVVWVWDWESDSLGLTLMTDSTPCSLCDCVSSLLML